MSAPVAYRMTVSFMGHTSSETCHAVNMGQLHDRAKAHGADTPDWTATGYAPTGYGPWILDRVHFTGEKGGEPIAVSFVALDTCDRCKQPTRHAETTEPGAVASLIARLCPKFCDIVTA